MNSHIFEVFLCFVADFGVYFLFSRNTIICRPNWLPGNENSFLNILCVCVKERENEGNKVNKKGIFIWGYLKIKLLTYHNHRHHPHCTFIIIFKVDIINDNKHNLLPRIHVVQNQMTKKTKQQHRSLWIAKLNNIRSCCFPKLTRPNARSPKRRWPSLIWRILTIEWQRLKNVRTSLK